MAKYIWSNQNKEIHTYRKTWGQKGFAKRILYEIDLMIWFGLLKTSISVIDNAYYLSEYQKRVIFFNNAVRFFNLDASKFE
ncbi:hypothetical protein [Maribacter algicola]|uniref:hypothetical protein n=1 Tax=Maribacter algicola TaxID=2498892 RepID=UPI000F65279D|nr:hypothetical protein [Maribacter algicola]